MANKLKGLETFDMSCLLGNTWSSVLTFAATLETQHLLAAVSHGFALAVRAPVVWVFRLVSVSVFCFMVEWH